ncbi:MAG: hypothetical protein PHI37_00380 [Candidatus Gracilibacteria bacterium]|nr:hypothetical protein [Candidatus Gracilibacteria bacterium]
MTITILEALYIVLIVFSSIIGTLLIIVLIRVIKILGPVMEILELYNKIKSIFAAYASIPDKIKDYAKEFLSKKDNE